MEWHWLIILGRSQGYDSTIHHLYIVLCAHHPKSSLLPSPFTLLYPPLHPPTPFPSGNHQIVTVHFFFFLFSFFFKIGETHIFSFTVLDIGKLVHIMIYIVMLLLCSSFFFFLFKYIYWLCYYSCPISTPSLHSILPTSSLPHSPTIVHVHGSYL